MSSRSSFFAIFAPALLLVPMIMPGVAWMWHGSSLALLGERLLLGGVLIVFFLSLFRQFSKGVLLLLPFTLLAPWETFYIWSYGRPSSAHVLAIVAETDVREATSYVQGLLWVFGGSFFLFVTAVFYFYSHGFDRQVWHEVWRRRILVLGGVAGLTISGAEVWYAQYDRAQAEVLADRVVFTEVRSSPALQLLRETYPFGLPIRVYDFLMQKHMLRQAKTRLEDFEFSAKQEGAAERREVYVLVIGESSRPDRWQLNGYERHTTPLLSETQGVVSFSNMVSSWAWTSMSVPAILTRKPPEDMRVFFEERSLISAFREAGFHTYWLSTQSPLGPHDSSIALHAEEADVTRYINPVDFRGSGLVDGKLLDGLDLVLGQSALKQLVVLHTLGSHFNYADRYPDDFNVFRPALRSGQSMHDRALRLELGNAYDNSILYTDFFLSEIIKRLESVGGLSSLFYVSDHGENLFDGQCLKSGHGHATEYDFRTAAIWWASESYRAMYPDKLNSVLQRANSPLGTFNVFHSMLDLARIRYPSEDLSLSIFSRQWTARARPLQNGLDFDESFSEPICKVLMPLVRQ